MVSLQRFHSGGRTYWRLVESRRVQGKPRPVPLLYLGTAERLFERLRAASPAAPLRMRSFQHGDVAALKAAADRLEVVSTIDRHIPKRARPLSVGTTLLLAAINRAIRPRSKRGWAGWARSTSLDRVFPGLDSQALTSQYFWDQMPCVSLEALRQIEEEITKKVVAELGLSLDTLFYDTSNFFTCIASTSRRPKLPQRGHSKRHRFDLRIFSLALLVTRDSHIPLLTHLYEGNVVDPTIFPTSLTQIRERLESLSLDLKEVTVVYDKGSLSRRNQALVDATSLGFVASLVPAHHPDLLAIPLSHYRVVDKGALAGLKLLRLERTLWGAKRTVVLFLGESLKAGQIRGLEQHLKKRLRKLLIWKEELAKPRSGSRSPQSAQRRIARILEGQHLKGVLRVDYDPQKKGADRLSFEVNAQARTQLEEEVFRKRLLVTNRQEWSEEEIVLAYRGQSHVEEAFRQLKDEEHLAVRPQYHWTDQNIHVHTFLCLLAYLLGRLVQREAKRAGWEGSASQLLDHLASVRLAMILHPTTEKGGRPRCQWQMEDAPPPTLALFRRLVPNNPPFVYTTPLA